MGKETTIYAPPELKAKVKQLSEMTGKPQWRILLEALELYERRSRINPVNSAVDKAVWYMQKLSMSIGALKENPSDENMSKTMKTIQQIKERLQVDTSLLERAVVEYVRLADFALSSSTEDPRFDEVAMEMGIALKSVLLEIVYKHIVQSERANAGE